MRFLPTAAAAQAAGFRACKRCRPDAAPGSPDWDVTSDVVDRALRLIADGVVDREGVDGLAARLGYSRRQLQRQMTDVLGAGPAALARAQRAQAARVLLETTELSMSDVAFAAGFGSIRQFNDTVRKVFATTPIALRRSARWWGPTTPGSVTVRLAYRQPLWPAGLFGHLVTEAVPGVEEWRDGAYRRTIRLPFGWGIVALSPQRDHIQCQLTLADMRDFSSAVARCRRLLDLDADPVAVDALLGQDLALRSLVRAAPGRRVPRTVDEHELAVRVVLGQQLTTAAARTRAFRLVVAAGYEIDDPCGGLTHLFPTATAIADIDPATFAMSNGRWRVVHMLANALAEGDLDLSVGGDWDAAQKHLSVIPGVGSWASSVIAMRALGDPDAFLPDDRDVRLAAQSLGLPSSRRALLERANHWRPWRSYAVQHLWGTVDDGRWSPHRFSRAA